MRYMNSFPKVQFITGPQATRLYADGARGHRFSASELAEIARQVEWEVSFQVRGTYTLSPAEVMTLVTEWMVSQPGADAKGGSSLHRLRTEPALAAADEPIEVPWSQFERRRA